MRTENKAKQKIYQLNIYLILQLLIKYMTNEVTNFTSFYYTLLISND